MSLPKDPDQMDKTMPPPPCKMEGSVEEQATKMAQQVIGNVYGALDSGNHSSLPFTPESIVSFQKGPSDRYQGQAILQGMSRLHPGKKRDLSGLTVHIFPGNSMLCLMCGDMETAASEQKSAAAGYKIRNRFADYMLILQGPSIRSAVFRELDEDCGPAPPGAVQGEQFTQGDQMAQQFLPFFYGQLDDPAKRGGLNDLFKDLSVVTVGNDMFRTTRHIAHKIHFMPQLVNPTARVISGCDVHPSPAGGFFIFVYGELQLQGETFRQQFIDLFHLMNENGSFWISNLIMKLHGGGSA